MASTTPRAYPRPWSPCSISRVATRMGLPVQNAHAVTSWRRMASQRSSSRLWSTRVPATSPTRSTRLRCRSAYKKARRRIALPARTATAAFQARAGPIAAMGRRTAGMRAGLRATAPHSTRRTPSCRESAPLSASMRPSDFLPKVGRFPRGEGFKVACDPRFYPQQESLSL